VLVRFGLPRRVRADPRLVRIDAHSGRVLDRFQEKWRDQPLDRELLER